jgi:carbon-monoxide dehydrogenase medium subunit
MKPAAFKYLVPNSLASAIEIMGQHGDEGKLLAGGQSLIPAMNFRLIQPTLLVDINDLEELDFIEPTKDGGLRIGAMTRQQAIERNMIVAERAPLLYETMPFVAHTQIRNRGTIGGSLVHADPAAELPVIMVALNSRFLVQSTNGKRWINADNCFQGIFTTVLTPEDILLEIRIPSISPRSGYAFLEFARRQGDYALSGVAVVLSLDVDGTFSEVRLVYLNAGDVPILASQAASVLVGEKPTNELFAEAAHIAAEQEIMPTGNIHATVDYLRHIAEVLTVRALSTALARINKDFH